MSWGYEKGDYIYAKLSQDGYYYYAEILAIEDDKALVKFFDVMSEYRSLDSLETIDNCVSNFHVQGNRGGKGYYYPCEIIDFNIQEYRFTVRYLQDGAEEPLELKMIRFEAPPSFNNVLDKSEVSFADDSEEVKNAVETKNNTLRRIGMILPIIAISAIVLLVALTTIAGFTVTEDLDKPHNLFNASTGWVLGLKSYYVLFLSTILMFSLTLFIINILRIKKYEGLLQGSLHRINVLLFCSLCFVEVLYILTSPLDSVWFCMPYDVGWGYATLGFILFGLVIVNQFFCYLSIISDLRYHSYGHFKYIYGVISWLVGFILFIIAIAITSLPQAELIVLVALLISQLIQIAFFFKGIVPKGGLFRFFKFTAVYLWGMIVLVMLLFHYIVMLIYVVIVGILAYIILWFVLNLLFGERVKIIYFRYRD